MAGTAAALAFASAAAEAQAPGGGTLDITSTSLPQAIAELSRKASATIGADGRLPNLRTPPVRHSRSVGDALDRMLAGSGYRARRVGAQTWRIERRPDRAAPVLSPRPTAPEGAQPAAVADAAPITVTAAKRPQPLIDLPMNIVVVRPSASEAHDPLRSTDWVASEIEGLSQTAAGPGRNRLFLRGIADSPFTGENQSTVAIMLDDARLTYSAPDPGVRLIDVERVEVLKGPQGSLYGTGALGGAYQIVTRRALIDRSSLSIAIGGQAIAGAGAGATGAAIMNLPLVRGRAALRLVGYAAQEPGWIDTGDRQNGNSGGVRGARANAGLDLGPGWRLDLTGFAQWLNVRDSQYVYTPGARLRPGQIAEPHDSELHHLAIRLGGQTGKTSITLSSALTWHELSDTLDATIGSSLAIDPRTLVANRRYRVWDNEIRASGRVHDIEWLVGLSHVRARQQAGQTITALAAAPATIDDDRRDTTDSALFGNVSLPLPGSVRLDLGGRLFHGRIAETRISPIGPVSFAQSRTGFTPGASLSWRPAEDRLLYLRYGAAQRQGGLDLRQAGQIQRLRSDKLSTVEAGWRERRGPAQLDVNAFATWWSHLQSDTLLPDGEIAETNAGRSRIVGIEASYARPLGPGWNISLGGTLQSADLVRTESGQRLRNRRLPIVPDYTVRGSLQHSFRLKGAAASVKVQLRYIGPATLSFDPALDRPVGRILESRLEGHLMRDGYDLSIRVDNPLGGKADTFAFGNPLRHSASLQYTPQRPPSAVVSVLKQF